MRVERVDQRAHVGGRVVAVEQVEVDRAAEAPMLSRRSLAMSAGVTRGTVALRMRALGDEHDPLAHAGAVAEPVARATSSAPPPS